MLRYMFQEEGQKVALQEIGPRFTLKVKRVQLGLFDNQFGEVEFEATDNMYVSRKRVYI
jgi:ribosome production factor 1